MAEIQAAGILKWAAKLDEVRKKAEKAPGFDKSSLRDVGGVLQAVKGVAQLIEQYRGEYRMLQTVVERAMGGDAKAISAFPDTRKNYDKKARDLTATLGDLEKLCAKLVKMGYKVANANNRPELQDICNFLSRWTYMLEQQVSAQKGLIAEQIAEVASDKVKKIERAASNAIICPHCKKAFVPAK